MSFGNYTREEVLAKLKAKQAKARTMSRTLKTAPKRIKKQKVKKVSLSSLKKKLWEKTKQEIREKYVVDGQVKCYTCDRFLTEKKDMHTAHFIDSSICGANMRYDHRNLRICCYACNVHKNGNKIEYYRRMVEEVGQEEVDQIYKDSKTLIHADTHWYLSKLAEN